MKIAIIIDHDNYKSYYQKGFYICDLINVAYLNDHFSEIRSGRSHYLEYRQ